MENEKVTIDSLEKKVEGKFQSWLSDFEKNPVKMGIKTLIVLWIIKKVYSWFK